MGGHAVKLWFSKCEDNKQIGLLKTVSAIAMLDECLRLIEQNSGLFKENRNSDFLFLNSSGFKFLWVWI